MHKFAMKKPSGKSGSLRFQVFTIVFHVILLATFGVQMTFSATEPGSGDAANPNPTSAVTADTSELETQCITEMNSFIEVQFADYKIFMEENFRNKSSTTSLLPNGIARYEQYKADLLKKFDEFKDSHNEGGVQLDQLSRLVQCRTNAFESIRGARSLLELQAEATSNVKKATAILDKYQQLNAKLRNLNLEFMRLKVNLDTFSEKLPCYLHTNCVKG